MNVLDLFSGIGGFSLGLERAGMRTVAFCECEPYARAVLAKHWPGVPCYPDVRELSAARLAADGIAVDVICGGFPCQDISLAGNGAGLAGERSGLWREYARLIGELRPRFVIVENVAALLSRGLAEVLGDLAEIGFDAEWHCIPASAVGAPHRRDRVWIVAYPKRDELREQSGRSRWPSRSDSLFAREYGAQEPLADAQGSSQPSQQEITDGRGPLVGTWPGTSSRTESGDTSTRGSNARSDQIASSAGNVADTSSERRGEAGELRRDEPAQRTSGSGETLANTSSGGWVQGDQNARRCGEGASETEERTRPSDGSWWLVEPDVGRVANGIPARAHRLRCLGNAVVPQIPEIIGRAIMRSIER